MELSDGSDASVTAPPAPLPHYLNAEGRAVARFSVEGNVVGKWSLNLSVGIWTFPAKKSFQLQIRNCDVWRLGSHHK
jgi:hypothetical protein